MDDAAGILGLSSLLERKPRALSGGQRQRVAMGRAMVREPAAYLMDEPLSNFDAKLRVDMRGQLSRLHDRLGVTTLYVTHDQVEAMTLGDRVTVLRGGRVQQVDTPQRLYRHPANLFVAAFIGSPSMNLVEATIDDGHLSFGELRLPLDRGHRPALGDGERVILGIRPEDLQDVAFSEPGLPTVEVRVEVVESLGSAIHLVFPIDAPPVDSDATSAVSGDGADDDAALLADEGGARFVAAVDPRSEIGEREPARLTVDPSRFHFFDVETGDSLVGSGS